MAFIATHLPGYILSCNLSGRVGATALGLIGFFNIIGGLSAGVLGQRFSKKKLLASIYLARAIVIGLLWLSTVPVTGALVGQIFGARYMSTLFGVVMLAHQVGAFLGAYLGGLSFDFLGSYEPVFWLSVGLGLLSALLHLPIREAPLVRGAAAQEG